MIFVDNAGIALPRLESRMQTPREHREAELEVIDAGSAFTDREHDSVDAAHLRFLGIDELFVQHIANEIELLRHQLPPTNVSGIETTARISAMITIRTVAALEMNPLLASRSSLRSFIRRRNGIVTNGSTNALVAIVTIVSFSGSMPTSMKSDPIKRATV